MVWFKVDDGFWSHPKVLELSDSAVALWTRAGAYCAGHLTDGEVKRSTLRVLAAGADVADELVVAGLWDETPDGWVFHDWAEYQPTRDQVLTERERGREKKRAQREKGAKSSGRGPDGRYVSPGDNREDNPGDALGVSSATRPDPTRPISTSNEVERGPRKRGTRIPEPFMLTTEMRAWAATEVPNVNVDASTRRFVDHWRAESGAKATKLDWVATWRNWLRRDAEHTGASKAHVRQEGNLAVVTQLAALDAAERRGIGS